MIPLRTLRFRPARLAIAGALYAAIHVGTSGAFSGGPPDGFCANPPNFRNCTLCHLDFEVNSGNGSLALLGLPATFTPGATYNLMVQLADPGQQRWGFELTAMGGLDQQAGSFTVTDATNTQLSDNAGTAPDFMKHTSDGTQFGFPDGPVTWSFQWTAPSADFGSVTFYFAGNAADGTEDPGLDYIYTQSATVEQGNVGVQDETWSGIKALYRKR